jgi:hypothetical protein
MTGSPRAIKGQKDKVRPFLQVMRESLNFEQFLADVVKDCIGSGSWAECL